MLTCREYLWLTARMCFFFGLAILCCDAVLAIAIASTIVRSIENVSSKIIIFTNTLAGSSVIFRIIKSCQRLIKTPHVGMRARLFFARQHIVHHYAFIISVALAVNGRVEDMPARGQTLRTPRPWYEFWIETTKKCIVLMQRSEVCSLDKKLGT